MIASGLNALSKVRIEPNLQSTVFPVEAQFLLTHFTLATLTYFSGLPDVELSVIIMIPLLKHIRTGRLQRKFLQLILFVKRTEVFLDTKRQSIKAIQIECTNLSA